MRVKVYPSDKGGCGMYRLWWPAEALAAKGFDVEVREDRPQLLNDGKRVFGLAQPLNADVVVFQRPARPQYQLAFQYFQSIGVKVVVDIDDDLSEIHPKNSAFLPYQQMGKMHWQHSIDACKMADLVICSTPALAEKYSNGSNAIVIPNHIPERYLNVAREEEEDVVSVGWAGFAGTHPGDLEITHGAINQALAESKGGRFLGFDPEAFRLLGIRMKDPHLKLPGVPIDKYPESLGQLDVGIVPLAETEFNRAKSWLKGLEYAACGVAAVVSPTPDNMRLVEAGAALAASSPKEWKDNVKLLIEDTEARESLQKKAREFASEWTIEGNTDKWQEAWIS